MPILMTRTGDDMTTAPRNAQPRRRRALALLLAGVVPLAGTPAGDECSRAPLRGTPPTAEEWSLVAAVSGRFRVRLHGGDDWIHFGAPEWTAAGLRAVGGEDWDTGRLVYTESHVVPWADIARLDGERGNHAGRGALLGAAAGAAVFAGLYACDDCGRGWRAGAAIPIGMVIGGVIGRWQPLWRPVYCAVSEPPR